MLKAKISALLTMLSLFLPFSPLVGQENVNADPAWWEMDHCNYHSCDDCRCCFENYSPRRIYLSHVEGDSVGFRNGYTTLGLFAIPPRWQNSVLQPFIDVRGHIFNNGRTAANLGGGVRYLDSCWSKVFGVNAYYDYREGHFRHYHQLGVGFEVLGPCWDLRLNFYYPIGKKIGEDSPHKFTFPGGLIAICRQREEALKGFDAEIGSCINAYLPQCCRCVSLYAAAGPYFYRSRSCAHDTWGGQVRVIAQKCCWDFEVGASYDRTYKTSGYARITLNTPFTWPCGNDCCAQECSLASQPVHRQEMIVLSKKHCFWKANF